MTIKMTASHARWPKVDDPIFAKLERVRKAKKKYGIKNIIDSTVGCLRDENGELITFNSVYSTFYSLDKNILASYAFVSGDLDFQNNVIDVCFGENKPSAFIRSVATVGGLGAVRHGIWTYVRENDYVICADWYWKAYEDICDELNRKFRTFKLFNDTYSFNINSFKYTLEESLIDKDRV